MIADPVFYALAVRTMVRLAVSDDGFLAHQPVGRQ